MICLVLLGAFFAVGGFSVLAQEDEVEETEAPVVVPEPGFTQASPFDNLAVILVIDVSGSMSYTDPLRLRETAAGMFIDLLGEEDYLGIIIFDDQADLVVPLGPVGSPANKASLMAKLSAELDPRGDTDFIEALALAQRQFAETDIGEKVPVVLLLTDGEPDPFPGSLEDEALMDDYMESLWEEVDLLAREGILVYTVGFSEEIDPEVIRRIATETRGSYYILQEPSELLVTFYRVLESLKDRRSFLEETVDLGSGGSHTFSFNAEEFTRQVNLVLVGAPETEEAGIAVTVRPPRGAVENIDQLYIGGRDNYVTVILSRPLQEHYGLWQVEINGSGEILALGNSDYYLETLLMEPDPGAHHPLYEPMDIRVEVITRERYADAVFRLEMEVTGPDDPGPIVVPMSREGNSFLGFYEYVDRPGDYELSWQLYRGEEALFSSTALVSVIPLPALSTDLWADSEGFRLGEEMIVSASLVSAGDRLQQGPNLQIDAMDLNIEYLDGARIQVGLFDSGSSEHGNSRAGDGIWSNRLKFDREGAARVVLTALGTYRGSNFVLKKALPVTVSAPGEVIVRLRPEELWSQPGRKIGLPLEFESRSPFTQTIYLSSGSGQVRLLQDRVIIPPDRTSALIVEAQFLDNVNPGSFSMALGFETEDGMTLVQPEVLDFEVLILNAGEAFFKRFSGLAFTIAAIAIALYLFSTLLFGGGKLINRRYLLPRLRVGGELAYHKKSGEVGRSETNLQFIDLGEAGKQEVVISFGRGHEKTDFWIEGESSEHDLIISNSWNEKLPLYWRGWRSLIQRTLKIETTISATPPGVLLFDDKVYSRRELHCGDQFETGGLIFRYQGKTEKGLQASDRGVNILDGKI